MEYEKRGQGAIELVILFGAVLFFFVVFMGIIQQNITEKNLEKEKKIIQNVALAVRDEINLAAKSSEGYFRQFKIPQNILGKDYEINITGEIVYVSCGNAWFSYKIHNVAGVIKKGENNITKQNETIYLN